MDKGWFFLNRDKKNNKIKHILNNFRHFEKGNGK